MPSSTSALRILAVDDDALMRNLLSDLLSIDGHHADVVGNAVEAIQLLLRHRYSILITDHQMPGMTGLELAREVRARGLPVPILLLSSDVGPVLETAAYQLGRAECLAKPFLIDGLRAAIERLVTSAMLDESETPRPRKH
jgi:CheY-like chemotaxis protein